MSAQLSIGALIRRGLEVHGTSNVRTYDGDRVEGASYTDVAERAGRLALALQERGLGPGGVVGACCWNTQAFLEVFLAIPGVGALVHTINPRLYADQLDYVMAHAGERLVICDASLLGTLTASNALALVDEVIVIGTPDQAGVDAIRSAGCSVTDYETLLAGTNGSYDWPDMDENLAATLCYTTGTTGDPKGAVYTQRAIVLHSLTECTVDALAVRQSDRVLLVSPMFHVNGWGLPYTAWLAGADMLMPGPYLQAPHLARLLREERPTFMTGVPTIYNDLRRHETGPDAAALDLSSLRTAMCGGSPVPRALIQYFRDRHGVALTQAWGMTENGLLTVAVPPDDATGEEELDWRERTGRLVAGIEARVVDDDGAVLPADGEAIGEIELRGWWVIASYHRGDGPERFHDGWLRTGDVGTLSADGWVQITDRAKDVIKSGGEWISSIHLEAAILSHPDVHEVAVIAVPDERWFERPLACVVLREDATAQIADLRDHLNGRVARWWLPERWAFVAEVPKTSVGKFDKKLLRSRFGAGELDVRLEPAATGPS